MSLFRAKVTPSSRAPCDVVCVSCLIFRGRGLFGGIPFRLRKTIRCHQSRRKRLTTPNDSTRACTSRTWTSLLLQRALAQSTWVVVAPRILFITSKHFPSKIIKYFCRYCTDELRGSLMTSVYNGWACARGRMYACSAPLSPPPSVHDFHFRHACARYAVVGNASLPRVFRRFCSSDSLANGFRLTPTNDSRNRKRAQHCCRILQ